MYEAYYGLREKPFSILPDPDFIYWTPGHTLAISMLEYSVMNCAGITVITGEIGSGKTTLIRELLNRFDKNKFNIGLLSHTSAVEDDLLQWLLMALGQPFEEQSYVALYTRFQKVLTDEKVWERFQTTAVIVGSSVIVQLIVGFLMALMFARPVRRLMRWLNSSRNCWKKKAISSDLIAP